MPGHLRNGALTTAGWALPREPIPHTQQTSQEADCCVRLAGSQAALSGDSPASAVTSLTMVPSRPGSDPHLSGALISVLLPTQNELEKPKTLPSPSTPRSVPKLLFPTVLTAISEFTHFVLNFSHSLKAPCVQRGRCNQTPQTRGLNNRHLFLMVQEDGRQDVKVRAVLVSF